MRTVSTMVNREVYLYAEEDVNVVLDSDMIHDHRAEVPAVERTEFAPSREFYNNMQDVGAITTVTVRHNQKLVGYCMVLLQRSHHHPKSVQGIVDCIYVHPDHRAKAGKRLIACTNNILAKQGITDVYHLVPDARDWSPVLVRDGFSKTETVWHKGLN